MKYGNHSGRKFWINPDNKVVDFSHVLAMDEHTENMFNEYFSEDLGRIMKKREKFIDEGRV